MSSKTPTPTADKTGSSYPSCSVKRGTNSSKKGSITPTLTAEGRAAFPLAVVSKVALTAVKWTASQLRQRPTKKGAVNLAVVVKPTPTAVKWAA